MFSLHKGVKAMLKRILAATIAVLMIMAFAVGCKPKKTEGTSSQKKPTSSKVESTDEWEDDESSQIADDEGDDWGDWEDYSSEIPEEKEPEEEEIEDMSKYDWTLNTSSAFFRDTEEAKQPAKK